MSVNLRRGRTVGWFLAAALATILVTQYWDCLSGSRRASIPAKTLITERIAVSATRAPTPPPLIASSLSMAPTSPPPAVEERQSVSFSRPTSPPKPGAKFLENQAVNELERVNKMVREYQDIMMRERRMRSSSARSRSNRTKKPKSKGIHIPPDAIRCACTGFSTMDPRPSWCTEFGKASGQMPTLSPSHICIAHKVCIDSDQRLHFVSEQEQDPQLWNDGIDRHDFPISLANGVVIRSSIAWKPPANSSVGGDYYARVTDKRAYERGRRFTDNGKWAPYGTLVLLGHATANHITHFLEPVGSLQIGVRDMMVDAYGPNENPCKSDDLSCFYRPSLIISNQVDLDNGNLWGENVLRMMFRDYDRKMEFSRWGTLSFADTNEMKCFEKLVLPGAFYGIWPHGADTTPFLHAIDEYIINHAKEENDRAKRANAERNDEHSALQVEHVAGDGSKRILIAHRTTKRTIVDHESFVQIVTKHAARVGAVVDVVQFGSKKFNEQLSLAKGARILMGIHGADLTNMLFLPANSVVIELNPLFFFENRFDELAQALGHKYMPWNCGTHECAFGGDRSHFDRYIQSHGLKYNYSDYTITTEAYGTFEWGWKGYVGFGCLACNDVTCCTGVRNGFYSELRESHIKIGEGKHADEIRSVLDDAFEHLKRR